MRDIKKSLYMESSICTTDNFPLFCLLQFLSFGVGVGLFLRPAQVCLRLCVCMRFSATGLHTLAEVGCEEKPDVGAHVWGPALECET